jgi:hypothetical protein
VDRANNQKFAHGDRRVDRLNEAIPTATADSIRNAFADYQNSPVVPGPGPLGKRAADSLVAGIMTADLGSD